MGSRTLVSLLVMIFIGAPVHANICRVANDGQDSNNGSTWALATTLQSALANGAGKACDETWVKRDVYKPDLSCFLVA